MLTITQSDCTAGLFADGLGSKGRRTQDPHSQIPSFRVSLQQIVYKIILLGDDQASYPSTNGLLEIAALRLRALPSLA